MQFYSVSSDGRVLLWSLSKSELTPELGMMLRLSGGDDEDAQASSLAGGCCFDFNPVRFRSVQTVNSKTVNSKTVNSKTVNSKRPFCCSGC